MKITEKVSIRYSVTRNDLRKEREQMALVIGHVALIQKSKKQGFTIDLIRRLREKGYDAVGIFAGECREPAYKAELEHRVEKCGLSGQVIFLGRRNDIPDLLKLLDVLVIPSFEGFPLAGLEAAAARVPVAACSAAGAEEFVRVSGDGICFAEDDVDEAVKAIEIILSHRDEMVKSGEAFAQKMSNAEYAANIKMMFEKIS